MDRLQQKLDDLAIALCEIDEHMTEDELLAGYNNARNAIAQARVEAGLLRAECERLTERQATEVELFRREHPADYESAEVAEWCKRAQAAEAERDRLRAALVKIFACPNWENRCGAWADVNDALRRAKAALEATDAR